MRRTTRSTVLAGVAAGAFAVTVAGTAPAAQAAYPGRNGKIAYVVGRNIWTVDAAGRGARQLTAVGSDSHPRWSPSGRLLAFERSKDVYVMTAAGTGMRRVTTTGRAHQPTWSPDGRSLAVVNVDPASGRGDLYRVPVAGGPMRRLTTDGQRSCGNDRPSWSPLGTSIVYHQRTGPGCRHNRILLLTLATGASRVVAEDGRLDPEDVVDQPDFAADGKHLVFMANCAAPGDCGLASDTLNVVVTDLRGGSRRFVDFTTGTEGDDRYDGVAAAPDGRHVVIVGHTWPGEPPVLSFLVVSGADRYTLLQRQPISQPDWQPLH